MFLPIAVLQVDAEIVCRMSDEDLRGMGVSKLGERIVLRRLCQSVRSKFCRSLD